VSTLPNMAFTRPKEGKRHGVTFPFTREVIQALHEGTGYADTYVGYCLPDSELALIYGVSPYEVSMARKRSSYWEEQTAPPVAESSTESTPEAVENKTAEGLPEVVEKSAASEEKALETPPKGDKKDKK
jgi:hypothetical protein